MKRRKEQTLFNNINNLKKEANMFLNINHNIGNFVNNMSLFLNQNIFTEKSAKEQEVSTDENNPNIQRDVREEFLRVVQYSSCNETSYADFIEKFGDNPKFSNVLTKKVDHQDLSKIETIFFDSIMEHLELLKRFELFNDHFYRFLADPLNEQYYPERENFKTEERYLKCVQEYEKKQAETSEKFEARFQEYEALIAESLAKIEQQLREPD